MQHVTRGRAIAACLLVAALAATAFAAAGLAAKKKPLAIAKSARFVWLTKVQSAKSRTFYRNALKKVG